jgi:hypothetical protein
VHRADSSTGDELRGEPKFVSRFCLPKIIHWRAVTPTRVVVALMGALGLVSKLLGDVRSIDDLVYRALVDLQLHVHRQSLLFTEVARALLPGGAGAQSALLVLLSIRVAASLFTMAMSAFDDHMRLEGERRPAVPQLALRRRASMSAQRLFRVGISLLEDDELDAELDGEDGDDDELDGDGYEGE